VKSSGHHARVNFASDKALILKREVNEFVISAAKSDTEKHLQNVKNSISSGVMPALSADGCNESIKLIKNQQNSKNV
jgi:hypothetical protein